MVVSDESEAISDMIFWFLTKITVLPTISDSMHFQRRTTVDLDVDPQT